MPEPAENLPLDWESLLGRVEAHGMYSQEKEVLRKLIETGRLQEQEGKHTLAKKFYDRALQKLERPVPEKKNTPDSKPLRFTSVSRHMEELRLRETKDLLSKKREVFPEAEKRYFEKALDDSSEGGARRLRDQLSESIVRYTSIKRKKSGEREGKNPEAGPYNSLENMRSFFTRVEAVDPRWLEDFKQLFKDIYVFKKLYRD